MWKEAVAETGIIFYLMLGVGIVGILAKVMNYVTLRKLVNAAGSMSKSTHKLMKLVRAKYEHACMVHDRVENVNAFVEKYIYEYRGFFLKIHTWRQIQIQSIWFAGILAAIGAVGHFMAHGFCEQVYQYGALGAAEMVALFVISQLSDESYKIEAAENYMVDYLENVCLHRYEKAYQKETESKGKAPQEPQSELQVNRQPEPQMHIQSEMESTALPQPKSQPNPQPQPELTAPLQPEPIPRVLPVSDLRRQEVRVSEQEKQEKQVEEKKETPAKEVLIRQILEEFMA